MLWAAATEIVCAFWGGAGMPTLANIIEHPTVTERNASRIVVQLRLEGFATSWAGKGRQDGEFCFGSEDGRLRLTNVEGELVSETLLGNEHFEAVNGVAFADNVIAISSRAEITFWAPAESNGGQWPPSVFPCGSHGVITIPAGRFIAPLGCTGIIMASVTGAPVQSMAIGRIRDPDRVIDCYKVTYLDERDLLACAVRSAGVATIQLPQASGGGQINSTTFPGLDVVDVCWMSAQSAPLALAALGRNGTLIFFRDVLHDRSPMTVKFNDVQGTAYRVFGAHGSVLLLTSAGLYVLEGLVERFLAGEDVVHVPTPGRFTGLEAVDANLCDGRWLLVVLPDGVLRFDLDLLFAEPRQA